MFQALTAARTVVRIVVHTARRMAAHIEAHMAARTAAHIQQAILQATAMNMNTAQAFPARLCQAIDWRKALK